MPSSKLTGLPATLFALTAFAANSVLCRLALQNGAIDPAGFTVIRLLSGAMTLAVIVLMVQGVSNLKPANLFAFRPIRTWLAALMLFAYAVFFSFAYVMLDTATGALILFAVVQFCLIGFGLFSGYRPTGKQWLGILVAIAGFVSLMLPGATRPSWSGLTMMAIAGAAWAIYTLEGKKAEDPILNTAENFIRAIPLTLLLALVTLSSLSIGWQGALLAIASGALASGLGYTVWYIALKQLTVTEAAISQLSVPLIAALGAVLIVDEPLTSNLMVSGALILGGICLVTLTRKKP